MIKYSVEPDRIFGFGFNFGYLWPKITISAKQSASVKISQKVLPNPKVEST